MELLVEGFEYLVAVFDVEMEVLLFAFEDSLDFVFVEHAVIEDVVLHLVLFIEVEHGEFGDISTVEGDECIG